MRQFLFTLCLCLSCLGIRAQEVDRLPLAQCAYLYFISGQGESLHAMMNDEMQAALPAAALGGTFSQLTAQFGPLQSAGNWQQTQSAGLTVCYRDLTFERLNLRFQVTFSADGRIAGLFVKPVPAPVPSQAAEPADAAVAELDTVVTCGDFRLPATLCLPRQALEAHRAVPCLVLVHGSGPHDRNESIGPNHPFRDLAWGLARRGIATLRYDKRTYVYRQRYVPEGREADYDVETVDDAVAAAALAQSLSQVAPDSVYVLGHSQGGLLAPRIAQRSSGLAGLVLLAAPARPLEDLLVEQVAYLNRLDPSAEGDKQLADLKRQVANLKLLGTPAFCDTIPLPLGFPRSYWAFALAYHPVEVAARLSLPVLVLQGERDYQVTMQDYALWQDGLRAKGNASFKVYPRLNHLLQEGTGMATPAEYTRPLPVPDYVLDDLTRFIRTARLE